MSHDDLYHKSPITGDRGETVVRDLLTKLHDKLDVLDWQSRQQTRVDVQSTIEFMLDELPREPYPEAMWHAKVGAVWT